MATQRKRYFKVADKVLRKAWSNDDLASLVRLMAYLNQRWARDNIPHDEAGYAEIGIMDLMVISGKRRADVARKSAERWRDIAEMSVQHRGDVTVILWPKFAEFQEFRSRTRDDSDPYVAPSASASETASETKRRKRKSAADAASVLAPESLSESDFQNLCAWAGEKHGLSEEIVRLAWERIYQWSHARGRKNRSWYRAAQNYITDGWALKGTGAKAPKTFDQQREDETFEWLRSVSDGRERKPLGGGAGATVRRLPERSD